MQNPIEKAYDQYCNSVLAYAKNRFETVVKPWLIKKGYHMLTGNGTWLVFDPKDLTLNDNHSDEIPHYVKQLLEREVPGMDGNDLWFAYA